jgi:hypothetical protein
MSVIESVLERLPGFKHRIHDDLESVEEGTRHPLTDSLQKQLLKYFAELDPAQLEGYSFERRQSAYEGASYDLYIYDGAGRLKFQGRAFQGAPHFWSS